MAPEHSSLAGEREHCQKTTSKSGVQRIKKSGRLTPFIIHSFMNQQQQKRLEQYKKKAFCSKRPKTANEAYAIKQLERREIRQQILTQKRQHDLPLISTSFQQFLNITSSNGLITREFRKEIDFTNDNFHFFDKQDVYELPSPWELYEANSRSHLEEFKITPIHYSAVLDLIMSALRSLQQTATQNVSLHVLDVVLNVLVKEYSIKVVGSMLDFMNDFFDLSFSVKMKSAIIQDLKSTIEFIKNDKLPNYPNSFPMSRKEFAEKEVHNQFLIQASILVDKLTKELESFEEIQDASSTDFQGIKLAYSTIVLFYKYYSEKSKIDCSSLDFVKSPFCQLLAYITQSRVMKKQEIDDEHSIGVHLSNLLFAMLPIINEN